MTVSWQPALGRFEKWSWRAVSGRKRYREECGRFPLMWIDLSQMKMELLHSLQESKADRILFGKKVKKTERVYVFGRKILYNKAEMLCRGIDSHSLYVT